MKRLAFVTGGSRGIGREIVGRLHRDGFYVAFTYVAQSSLAQEVVDQCDGQPLAIAMDQSDSGQIKNALHRAKAHFGRSVSVLVNNAATAQEKAFRDISEEDFDRMVAVNLRGPFLLCQEVVEDMCTQEWGRIINISSIGGQWGGVNQVHYAVAKAGLENLTRSLAKMYSQFGVLANTVSIGLVETDMTTRELRRKDGKDKVAAIPMGRVGTATEVAAAVAFLASDEASYLAGQCMDLNGGMRFGS